MFYLKSHALIPGHRSGLAAADSNGVECDLCHQITNPDNSEHRGVMNDPFIANGSITEDPKDYTNKAATVTVAAAAVVPLPDRRHKIRIKHRPMFKPGVNCSPGNRFRPGPRLRPEPGPKPRLNLKSGPS